MFPAQPRAKGFPHWHGPTDGCSGVIKPVNIFLSSSQETPRLITGVSDFSLRCAEKNAARRLRGMKGSLNAENEPTEPFGCSKITRIYLFFPNCDENGHFNIGAGQFL